MTPQSISTAAAIVLSLLFSYVPGLSNWYGTQDPVHKRLIMLGLLVAVAAGSFALFSSIFNYLPFRLNGSPFNLSTEMTTSLYLAYVIGIFMGPLAGRISNRIGG